MFYYTSKTYYTYHEKINQNNIEYDRPKGILLEWQLWQTKMGKKERGEPVVTGFTDADGKHTELKSGEIFEINRYPNGDRAAILRRADGTMEILKKWSPDKKYIV